MQKEMVFVGGLPDAAPRGKVRYDPTQSRSFKQPYRVYAADSIIHPTIMSQETLGRYWLLKVYEERENT